MEFFNDDINNGANNRGWPISPLVGEMSAQPTEGGAVPPASHCFAPPSALPAALARAAGLGPSFGPPTRGEIGYAIVAETAADVAAREALLDRAMGPKRKKKSSEKLRRGRRPSEGLAFVARDAGGAVVGTVRLWDVRFAFSPLERGPKDGPRKVAQAQRPGRPEGVPSEGTAGMPSAWQATPSAAFGGTFPSRGEGRALLLGPLAVDPSVKSAGIGSALMAHAIAEAERLGHGAILLVGDAPYYARFGFSAEKTVTLAMPGPYELHRFLALELVGGALDGAGGVLRATGRKLAKANMLPALRASKAA